jgi:hypothetical protein
MIKTQMTRGSPAAVALIMLRFAVLKKSKWLWLETLHAAATTAELQQCSSHCPCCWSCNIISDWKVFTEIPRLFRKNMTYSLNPFNPLCKWHVCIACTWPIGFELYHIIITWINWMWQQNGCRGRDKNSKTGECWLVAEGKSVKWNKFD